MMKNIITSTITALLLAAGTLSCSNDKDKEEPLEIEDANFLRVCLMLHDSNGDGVFTKQEAEEVTELIISTESIRSVKGIEFFTNLEYFDCSENFISEIDVSACPKLKVLKANWNPLKKLNVSGNPLLEELTCSPRDIVNANTEPVGKEPGQLESLDVSKNPKIKTLNLNGLNLKELNIGNNPALTELYCSNNEIGSLDLTHCKGLIELYAPDAGLQNIKLPSNGTLTRLTLDGNELTSVDLSGQSSLYIAGISFNKLTEVRLDGCTSLFNFGCMYNELTELRITGTPNLNRLNTSGNEGITIYTTAEIYGNLFNPSATNPDATFVTE